MRKAQATDIGSILVLLRDNFVFSWETPGEKVNESYLKKNVLEGIKNDTFLVEERNKKIIGIGWAKKNKDSLGNIYGEIKLIAIQKESDVKAFGRKLLNQLEARFKTNDLRLAFPNIN